MWIQSMAAVLLLASSACSSSSMESAAHEMNGALSDARAENARHQGTCAAAESLPDVMTELTMHESAMNGTMTDMDHAMGKMMGCSSSEMDRVAAGISGVRSDMAGHRARLETASDIQAAHDECAAHHSALETKLSTMGADTGHMSCMMMGK
ncbi:MAG TPA: hypothetical protein VG937_00270 [Polyangiaceae bacterium]|nr:hypothetical protein [Polyangiaceae bacterium]